MRNAKWVRCCCNSFRIYLCVFDNTATLQHCNRKVVTSHQPKPEKKNKGWTYRGSCASPQTALQSHSKPAVKAPMKDYFDICRPKPTIYYQINKNRYYTWSKPKGQEIGKSLKGSFFAFGLPDFLAHSGIFVVVFEVKWINYSSHNNSSLLNSHSKLIELILCVGWDPPPPLHCLRRAVANSVKWGNRSPHRSPFVAHVSWGVVITIRRFTQKHAYSPTAVLLRGAMRHSRYFDLRCDAGTWSGTTALYRLPIITDSVDELSYRTR